MARTKSNNNIDRQLVESILNGNTHEFGLIIKNTEGLVAQIIFKMIRNDQDRKDIVQDVYLKVFKGLSKFRFQAKLSTWVGQITYNTCLNYLEKNKWPRIKNRSDKDDSHEEALEALSNRSIRSSCNEIEIQIHRKELSGILNNEIDKLSPVYRTLITLYHSEELSYTTIGEITQLPAGTVKNYLFRARKTLRENLLAKFKKDEL